MKRTDFIGRRSRARWFLGKNWCSKIKFGALLALFFIVYLLYFNRFLHNIQFNTGTKNVRKTAKDYRSAKENLHKEIEKLMPDIIPHKKRDNGVADYEESQKEAGEESEEVMERDEAEKEVDAESLDAMEVSNGDSSLDNDIYEVIIEDGNTFSTDLEGESSPEEVLIEDVVLEEYNGEKKNKNLQIIEHNVYWSNTRRFFTIDAFLFDGDRARPQFSSKNSDILIVIFGIGEFTARPSSKGKASDGRTPKEIPDLFMSFTSEYLDEEIELPVFVHTNGTYFQRKFDRKGNHKYIGEKGVWLTAVVPVEAALIVEERSTYSSLVGEVRVFSRDDSLIFKHHPFEINGIQVSNMIAPDIAENELVLCSAAIYNVNGYRFLLEYILYHKLMGFDKMHLYFYSRAFLDKIFPLLEHFSDDVIAHDWSTLPGNAVPSVRTKNYEHAQRFTRNDCFFRNRGLSRYIAFNDYDELFVPNYFDTTYESSRYIESITKALKDEALDDFMSTSSFEGIKKFLTYFDKVYENDNKKIGFAFTSVTVPPVDVRDQKFYQDEMLANPDIKVCKPGSSQSLDLYLNQMSVSELKCSYPYNCGRYHEGRQKYILRVAKGSINPNNPLFYHAISEEYKKISNTLMVQVPLAIGHLRHFAGHFRTSRFGGLPLNNRKILPLPQFVLHNMKSYLESHEELLEYYFHQENTKETFLQLSDFNNINRFIKVLDNEEGYELNNLERDPVDEKFLTFERFPGRLNNQLFSYDWVFRFSKAFNRTLYISKPRKMVCYIGLPQTKEEELQQAAIWNTKLLRKNFNFVMHYELEDLDESIQELILKPVEELPDRCVWHFEKNNKNLVAFMKAAVRYDDCKRIHFRTNTGLIHPYRSDTRSLGVGPLYFWSSIEVNSYVHNPVLDFITKVKENSPEKTLLSFHIRQFDKTKAVDGVCERISRKLLKAATKYVNNYKDCCRKPIFNGRLHLQDSSLLDVDLTAFQEEIGYFDMCEFSEEYLQKFNVGDKEKYSIVFAHDHRNPNVQPLFEAYGGVVFNSTEVIFRKRPEGAVMHSKREEIESVLGDLLAIAQGDFFHGTGASTFSQVICFMRMVKAQRSGYHERSNICSLAFLSTGSSDCDTIECNALDIDVSVIYNLAN